MSGSILALTATHVEKTLKPVKSVVSVFDLESDGGIDLQSVVQTERVNITEGLTPPPPSPSPSASVGKHQYKVGKFSHMNYVLLYNTGSKCSGGIYPNIDYTPNDIHRTKTYYTPENCAV